MLPGIRRVVPHEQQVGDAPDGVVPQRPERCDRDALVQPHWIVARSHGGTEGMFRGESAGSEPGRADESTGFELTIVLIRRRIGMFCEKKLVPSA